MQFLFKRTETGNRNDVREKGRHSAFLLLKEMQDEHVKAEEKPCKQKMGKQ